MEGVDRRRLSPALAGLLTFVAAAAVLVLEIAAGRLLAPYVGVSLTTYTGIIGVILAGIALGAWAGGRAADRYGPARLLGPTFVAGGLAAIVSVPIVTILGEGGIGRVGGDFFEIVVLAALGFVAPATILSAVAPMIVRASLTDVATSGSLVGRLSAIGTAGAITGTFLTGFVLLGTVPTRLLIVAAGVLLVVVGLALMLRGARRRSGVVATLLAIALCAATATAALSSPGRCEIESRYYCMTVREDAGNPTRRTLVLDGLSHAFVDTDDPDNIRFWYVRRFRDVAAGVAERRGGEFAALHLGGGGFSFPRYLESEYPASRHTILELDPAVLAVARERLAYAPTERTSVRLGDARLSIASVADDSVDLAVGDAFGGLAVPWHLTTREFLTQVDRVLTADGVYVANLIDYEPFGLVRAEVRTAQTLFRHVAVLAGAPVGTRASGGNVLLIASHEPIDIGAIQARADESGEGAGPILADEAGIAEFIGDAPLLTDDFAPVDQLLSRAR